MINRTATREVVLLGRIRLKYQRLYMAGRTLAANNQRSPPTTETLNLPIRDVDNLVNVKVFLNEPGRRPLRGSIDTFASALEYIIQRKYMDPT
ncbi:hypothetical protein EYZ11_000577 [Aspergillus tanneri]|uniref:Uncharacterized protein n=1 Tax=Aspergillus tanneri TaxID=1220188 RepID=A0A4S3JWW8_9EURO|nr:hypothetical protein EYZ11_000577 [Aspergillus tanneri]